MSRLRVAVTTSDMQACGHLRVRWPAHILAERGDIELIPYDQIKVECSGVVNGDVQIAGLIDPPDADVLIVQRLCEQALVDAIPHFQKLGVAVVVDLDDDLQHLPPAHPQYRVYNTNMTGWKNLKRACSMADMVIASTPGIAATYAPHGRVRTLRNLIPAWYLGLGPGPSDNDRIIVGWGGAVNNHPGDLEVTRGGVGQAVDEVSEADFRVVGSREGVVKALRLSSEPSETGLVEFLHYPYLVSHLDVGIAPLADNRYNQQGKSWLKVLEYSALGITWVASPQSEYLEFARRSGVGTIARDRSREWYRGVLRLLRDPWLREDEGARGQEYVRENLLLEDHVELWLEAWRAAAENRQRVAA